MTPSVSLSDNNLISEVISALRACCQVDVLSQWRISGELDDISAVREFERWDIAEINSKGHLAWGGGRQVIWLVQRLVVPQALNGYPLVGLSLRLALTWWGDAAQVFVNGKLVTEGDLFDCSPRVLVSEGVSPGEEFVVAIRLVSPGHCDGALVRSLCIYEARGLDPGFLADELAVVQRFVEVFAPENLSVLAGLVEGMNRQDAKGAKREEEEFEKSLLSLRENLIQSKIYNPKSKIYLLGHAHLDLAWLWRVSETWEAAQRTFESVLGLQEDFEELIFCHSSPALYAWVEENRPDLFAAIQEKVAAGVWEVVGSFWVEPDLNLISGESIVRQLLYGQRYVLEKFGKVSPVVWVPDSFGFCWSLPQFMQQGGVEFFVTQKLRWNDTTKFPYDVFWWKSPDGSEIFSLMSALIGETIDPVKMAAYACEWQSQTRIANCLWLPGVGDHGGGPTRDMLEIARRWQHSPLFPQLEFTTAEKFLREIQGTREEGQEESRVQSAGSKREISSSHTPFPTWNDELYLEYHRGCYTTHADQKRWNRRCENLLYEVELFASLASISAGVSYPQAELEAAWKQVLFHQFHDILPGSSITEVYSDALGAWLAVEKLGTEILHQSLEAIASQISLPAPPHPEALPLVVFNSLNWQRSEVVTVSLPDGEKNWEIYDLDGEAVPCQYNLTPLNTPLSSTGEGLGMRSLLFLAQDIPSVGYRLFWLSLQASESAIGTGKANITDSISESEQSFANKKIFEGNNFVLENQFLRVIVDEVTGNLASIFDKINNREVLQEPGGNQLQAFQDSGQYWDAWNIDPNYQQHPLEAPQLKSITWVEQGCVESRVRVVRQIGESEFCQDYILQAGSPLLKIATTVNWQESHVLVKAAFPLNLEADFATYEIPCAAIRRTTKPQTPAEQAKWEVPALRWADLTATELGNEENSSQSTIQNSYGVSLLNDCKYGYDSKPNQLRLTLLRSPHWPDSEADKGTHEFTYAIYPHAGSWEAAHTVRRGCELNQKLQVFLLGQNIPASSPQSLPPVGSLLNLSSENLILMAFKQSEDNPQDWILRCYECHGEVAELCLVSDLGLSLGEAVDLLEREVAVSEASVTGESVKIQPWKITSFRVRCQY